MIVYTASKEQFHADVFSNCIENKIHDLVYQKLHRRVADNEVRAWKNSMQYMERVLQDEDIPSNSSVAIEYGIPFSCKRIDFIIAGRDQNKKDIVVIIELKQWKSITLTDKDAIVETFINNGMHECEHPSYQAWTYSALLKDYNTALQDGTIELKPCAYLHNCESDTEIRDKRYREYTQRAPVFVQADAMKLRNFIKNYIRFGDKNHIMYCIENGKIRPSKQLADALSSMLAGKREFYMIDEQKLVYENVLNTVRQTGIEAARKKVFIIEGGPGTGKSVVAINLLVNITNLRKVVQYVTKNSAPRAVYTAKLTGSMKKTHINNLFQGSGSYYSIEKNTFDALIVDEAHRLNAKSGMFQNLGENQIKEIIEAAKVSIFFVDDDQVVTFKDIGQTAQIREFAKKAEAEIKCFTLSSQFRCNGSSSYLAWLDYVLDIRQTANFELDQESFDFRVFDDPNELRKIIELRNLETGSARIVAGYCWDWKSKNNKGEYDIEIPAFDFKMRWNLSTDGMLWILKDNSVSEVGCIHTCQGLELDYVGVIIGDDFVVRNGIVQTNPNKRSKMDQSVKGYKSLLKSDPAGARKKADAIIKNTYKTLLTRGQKGCFIYCTDKETSVYFKSFLSQPAETVTEEVQILPFTIIDDFSKIVPFTNAIPVVNFKAAAGDFSGFQNIEEFEWAILPEPYTPRPGYFICQVTGESMNKKIPNGSWCLFKTDSGGTREGKTVLVQHVKIQDNEFGGKYTVKRYHSIKEQTEDGWSHTRIVLKPSSFFTHYPDIVLEQDDLANLKVVGELVAVLG